MPEKDPTTYELATYLWVFLLSMWGGAVSYIRRISEGRASPNKFIRFCEFMGEILTSAFVGVITFYLCEAAGMSQLLTAVCVSVCGHMGTRAIYQLEYYVSMRLGLLEHPDRQKIHNRDSDNGG